MGNDNGLNGSLTGTIKLVDEEQVFESGFNKRDIVLTVSDGNYDQDVKVSFMKERTELVANLKEGEDITVSYNIRGKEYNGKYYVELIGWKVTADDET
jgi:hypothetical protein